MHIDVIQYGNTALILASREGHAEIVKLLLQNHADITLQTKVRSV